MGELASCAKHSSFSNELVLISGSFYVSHVSQVKPLWLTKTWRGPSCRLELLQIMVKARSKNAYRRPGKTVLKHHLKRATRAQGVVSTTPLQARGGLSRSKGAGVNSKGKPVSHEACLNAFLPGHLTLPRAVAPYSVIRTIVNFPVSTDNRGKLLVIQPMLNKDGDEYGFTNCVGWISDTDQSSGEVPTTTTPTGINMPSVGNSGVECVPAAITARITCPSPLISATGQLFLGRWNVPGDRTNYTNYGDMEKGFLAFAKPEPYTAAMMATSARQVSAIPRDFNDYCEFHKYVDNDFSDSLRPWGGMTPIIMALNPTTGTNTNYNVQICVEWRYRFKMDDPAASAHQFHKPSSLDAINATAARMANKPGVELMNQRAMNKAAGLSQSVLTM
jgi:hypothetical protein